jgi:hypothetical protein
MTFSYYEYTSSPTDTEFVFLVTDTNGPTCNNKAFCTDVCGWSLAVSDAGHCRDCVCLPASAVWWGQVG